MNYRYYFHPENKTKVMVFNNGFSHGNRKAFTIKSINGEKEKYLPSAKACDSYLTERGYIKECETRKKNKK
jgi:hypothetical protein